MDLVEREVGGYDSGSVTLSLIHLRGGFGGVASVGWAMETVSTSNAGRPTLVPK